MRIKKGLILGLALSVLLSGSWQRIRAEVKDETSAQELIKGIRKHDSNILEAFKNIIKAFQKKQVEQKKEFQEQINRLKEESGEVTLREQGPLESEIKKEILTQREVTPAPTIIPTEIESREGFSPRQIEAKEVPQDKLARFQAPISLIEAKGVPLEAVLQKIAWTIGVDLVIKDDVDREIFVQPRIKNRPVYKAIRDILSRYRYSFRLSDTRLTVFKFERRRFNLVLGPIDYKHRVIVTSESKQMRETTTGTTEKSKLGATTHIESELLFTFWEELDMNLSSMVSPEGIYTINKSEGIIEVKDYSVILDEIAEYLRIINEWASRQVLVEAKIIEVTLSDEKAWGIDWDMLYQRVGSIRNLSWSTGLISGVVTSNTVTAQASGPNVGAGETAEGIKGLINALDSQGEVNIVSQPKVLLLNNIPAKIQVVKKTAYISEVEKEIYGTDQRSYAVTTDEILEGVILELSARIIDKDNIYLNLTPIIKSLYGTTIPEEEFENITIQLPQTNDRAMTTTIRIRDGETVLIGGLIQEQEQKNVKKVPILGSIPFLGVLFRSESTTKEKTEVVIMITCTIVNI